MPSVPCCRGRSSQASARAAFAARNAAIAAALPTAVAAGPSTVATAAALPTAVAAAPATLPTASCAIPTGSSATPTPQKIEGAAVTSNVPGPTTSARDGRSHGRQLSASVQQAAQLQPGAASSPAALLPLVSTAQSGMTGPAHPSVTFGKALSFVADTIVRAALPVLG